MDEPRNYISQDSLKGGNFVVMATGKRRPLALAETCALNVKLLRARNEWSLERLAAEANMSTSMLGKKIGPQRSSYPPFDLTELEGLANAFGVSPVQLLDRTVLDALGPTERAIKASAEKPRAARPARRKQVG